ncbi:MAG: LTA synthase family protein, partial [Candidatus Adiutrix sp.]
MSRKFTVDYSFLESALFHLKMPLSGVDELLVASWVKNCLLVPLALTGLYFVCLIFQSRRPLMGWGKIFNLTIKHLPLAMVFVSLIVLYKFDIYEFTKLSFFGVPSTLYENHYVHHHDIEVSFPTHKKNLILVLLESIETTYSNPEIFTEDLIPEFSQLAEKNIAFNNFYQVARTHWSIASRVAYLSGLPLSVPVEGNSMGAYKQFLPNASSLPKILLENGYEALAMSGVDFKFAGTEVFLKTHGMIIKDLKYYQPFIPNSHELWGTQWGFKDSVVYNLAKEELLSLKEKKPFFLFFVTADTHFPKGYFDGDNCTPLSGGDYKDAIRCASKLGGDFAQWVDDNGFLDDTVLVFVGDHLGMRTEIYDKYMVPNQDKRRIFNAIITKDGTISQFDPNRAVSHFDFFPTILSLMGAHIPGGRLGLGVDLLDVQQKTLLETLGANDFDRQ